MELTETLYCVSDKGYGLNYRRWTVHCYLVIIFLFVSLWSFGQKKNKGESIFGIEVKAIIPSTVLNTGPVNMGNDSMNIVIDPVEGYSFGMMIRHNFTKMFTLETGIHFESKKYTFNVANINSGSNASSSVRLISYEIPVQWLIYIRLGQQIYMNALFGVSFDFYPSDVTNLKDNFEYIIIRNSWINVALLGSIGFEYRTKNSGIFYIGGSLHYPFSDIAKVRLTQYKTFPPTDFVNFDTTLNGTYFSVELRYFFKKIVYKEPPKVY